MFGLFLGLCLWKFGNPVILDQKISAPASAAEFLNFAWPTHWANWIFLPLAVAGIALILVRREPRPTVSRFHRPMFWLPPLLWFGWQLVSATQTVDAELTATVLGQFAGCAASYFLGALLIGAPGAGAKTGQPRALYFLLIGVLAAFAFCLVRAADQRLFEFPQTRQMLEAGERAHWTNFPPETLAQMKRENVIVTTNGVDIANPVFLAKFAKDRVSGTLVYPNALAGTVLLLGPASLTLAFGARKLRPTIRYAVVALTIFLVGGGLFWSGSKAGWLIALGLGGLYLLRLRWPAKLKVAALLTVAVLGLGIFAVRFHHYFAAGARSVGARLDYWRAALQTTGNNPLFGTGPGTFQRPYAQLKSPDAEMARLAHNDYLEQFSDSGVPGGIFYLAWIAPALVFIGRKVWNGEGREFTGGPGALYFALFAGLLGWFLQGLGEFELYIPALAWTAFTLLGCLAALT
ncbi:MAG TPA: O-antigen ligase family protein [Verrucomicrobiae bacterium]|nr:O-antigen ligase family protein [Verrucomicrobiae bacterium]